MTPHQRGVERERELPVPSTLSLLGVVERDNDGKATVVKANKFIATVFMQKVILLRIQNLAL
jgi:hypothetical protein